jgi:hypothetical protein
MNVMYKNFIVFLDVIIINNEYYAISLHFQLFLYPMSAVNIHIASKKKFIKKHFLLHDMI